MIQVTHLNHTPFVLNSDLIEQIESTPDTVITLTNHQKLTVLETAEEIVERVRLYRQSILHSPWTAGETRTALMNKLSERKTNG